MTLLIVICCLAAYAIGGIPFGYLIGRLVLKDDIRKHGSGNIGATNVARVIGWKWGSVVLFLDALKGLLPTLATGWIVFARETEFQLPSEIAAGLSAIVGHMYPIWLRLRGGKGVATALGVVLVVAPIASAVAVGAFALIMLATRIVALSSITAAFAFAVAEFVQLGGTAFLWPNWPLAVFAILVPALIIWRHRSNVMRLLRGEEKAIRGADSRSPES